MRAVAHSATVVELNTAPVCLGLIGTDWMKPRGEADKEKAGRATGAQCHLSLCICTTSKLYPKNRNHVMPWAVSVTSAVTDLNRVFRMKTCNQTCIQLCFLHPYTHKVVQFFNLKMLRYSEIITLATIVLPFKFSSGVLKNKQHFTSYFAWLHHHRFCSPASSIGRELYVHKSTFKLFKDLINITKITQTRFCAGVNFFYHNYSLDLHNDLTMEIQKVLGC